MQNRVRIALKNREVTLGTWIQIGHPAIAEILANLDFDWIAADCEHSEMTIADFAMVSRGIYGRGPVPLVRVRENDTLAIRQALDVGAQGIIVPLVNSRAEAERAVAAARFPPHGVRGFAFFRANNYGSDFQAYADEANQEIAVIVMIETRQAVEAIDEILAVDGVDGVFVGPYDLSGSYGVPGKLAHCDVTNAQKRVVAACDRAGKSAGVHLVNPNAETVGAAIAAGFTFVALGMDTVFLHTAAEAALLAATRAVTARADQ